jgi:hypothetical protein
VQTVKAALVAAIGVVALVVSLLPALAGENENLALTVSIDGVRAEAPADALVRHKVARVLQRAGLAEAKRDPSVGWIMCIGRQAEIKRRIRRWTRSDCIRRVRKLVPAVGRIELDADTPEVNRPTTRNSPSSMFAAVSPTDPVQNAARPAVSSEALDACPEPDVCTGAPIEVTSATARAEHRYREQRRRLARPSSDAAASHAARACSPGAVARGASTWATETTCARHGRRFARWTRPDFRLA